MWGQETNEPKGKLGQVHKIDGPLKLCTRNALHATYKPDEWKGSRIWIVAIHPPFQVDGDKLGSLKREIIAEAK